MGNPYADQLHATCCNSGVLHTACSLRLNPKTSSCCNNDSAN